MKNAFIILISLFILSLQAKGQEFITVKGKVSNTIDGDFIGAMVEEYGNLHNNVYTDINGEFEIIIPKRDKNILRITYACSAFDDFLYEVTKDEEYSLIEIYTKRANKRTKKIRKLLKRK